MLKNQACAAHSLLQQTGRGRALLIAVVMKMAVSFVLTVSLPVQAVEQVDLYTVVSEVASRSAAARNRAARQALQTVYIRCSGDTEVLKNFPSLNSSLTNAQQYLSSYQYQEIEYQPETDSGANDEELSPPAEMKTETLLQLQLSFDEQQVRQQLMSAGAPQWQAIRPSVLVWLVEQREGQRFFVGPASSPDLYQGLIDRAALRGLPLIYPVQENTLRPTLSSDDIWDLQQQAIEEASKGYHADVILIGKAAQTYTQGWIGQWGILEAGTLTTVRYQHEDVSAVTAAGIDRVVDKLSSRFAVATGTQAGRFRYTLTINNIQSQSDYFAMMQYLQAMDSFDHLMLIELDGQRCLLTVEFTGDTEKMQALFALDTHMQPISETGLVFNWQP